MQTLRMILAGLFDRFPNLKVVSGHWGEMLPPFLSRLDDALPPPITGLRRTIGETYRARVWVTPNGMLDPALFRLCLDLLGAERIMWSADYPYLTLDGHRDFLEALPVSEADRDRIARGNAEVLFKLTGG